MTDLKAFFADIVARRASDVFFIAGLPPAYKVDGRLLRMDGERLIPAQTAELVDQLYEMTGGRSKQRLETLGEDDFAFSLPGLSRFRANVYRQRGSLAAVIRVITFALPDPEAIHIPAGVMGLSALASGLVLVTGPAGSGKTTTIACLIDRINRTREGHIITLEDPIEYLHRHQKSIVSQREIGEDTEGYVPALRAALRQAPDVILLGEMRDYETIRTAMTAAETGHLVISTMHTAGAVGAVDRVIDVFPPDQQGQVRLQLSMVLRAVVSQQLVQTAAGGILPAFELLRVNPAVSNLIRDSKVHQIGAVMQASRDEGMVTMDAELLRLCREGTVSPQEALRCSFDRAQMERKLQYA
ncbi:MAG: PilT/PilU family type 4a pilus ATPase [Eubacteriales bacterium]|nr:PilT/PilU family type 4a pilus ATPase [Eubacteriales bacterium]